jgi:hypothetical protein
MGRSVWIIATTDAEKFGVQPHELLQYAKVQTTACILHGWENVVYDYLGMDEGDHDIDFEDLQETMLDIQYNLEDETISEDTKYEYNTFIDQMKPFLDSQEQYDWHYRVEDSY